MEKNSRLAKIREENLRWEKTSPYNFCDRWCERCPSHTQVRCSLYLEELERQAICMAHGRDPDDPQMTEEILKQQYDSMEERLEDHMEESEDFDIDEEDLINLDEMEGPEWEKIKQHIQFVENNSLEPTAEQYRRRADQFLERTFFANKKWSPEVAYHFETIAWYHTLLPAKLHRALCGFHEPMAEGEIALYDSVAQLDVCQKAIQNSLTALRFVEPHCPQEKMTILELRALLHNILSRIIALEESIG